MKQTFNKRGVSVNEGEIRFFVFFFAHEGGCLVLSETNAASGELSWKLHVHTESL